MTETRIYYEVPDTVPIRQGDIIRSDGAGDGSVSRYIIITADCDITQRKMGPFFTCLEIVAASEYISFYWAADELEKLRRKYEAEAIDLIFAADRARDSKVERLTCSDLLDWLHADGPEKIVAILQMSGRAADDCVRALKIVGFAIESAATPLDRLKEVWALLKRSPKDQQGAIRTALKAGQMRSDYILIPALPAEREVGFVVLLRSMRSVSPETIHTSQLAYRIDGATDGYFRLGRLQDFLRYSIAQRWASLYSRIGMTDHFEAECDTAAEIVLSQL